MADMRQDELWHEDIDDALDTLIKAIGGYKKVSAWLWPSSNSKSAYARLKACVNPEKAERLSPDELIRLATKGREIGCHAVMHYFEQACGYAGTKPVEPKDLMADLQERYIEHAKIMQKIAEQISRHQVRAVS